MAEGRDRRTGAVYKYGMNGDDTNFSFLLTPANADPQGITTDGTGIWVVDIKDDDVYKYNMSGTYTGFSFLLETGNNSGRGIRVTTK